VAKQNVVYNIPYINAILEKAQAYADLERIRIDKLADKAMSSSSILDKPKVQHTSIDMAVTQYNWKKMQEDAELERKFNEIMK
jgi:hypothetical protein